jgi:hypothetical protein
MSEVEGVQFVPESYVLPVPFVGGPLDGETLWIDCPLPRRYAVPCLSGSVPSFCGEDETRPIGNRPTIRHAYYRLERCWADDESERKVPRYVFDR